MSQRLKFAEKNGWNEQAAKQYINLFLLWSFYFQDYAINTGVSAESQLS